MNVLLFSDLHDSSRGLWAILEFLKKRQDISALVFAGDVVNMGGPVNFAEKFITEISQFSLPLLWVPGNNDFGASYKVLQKYTPSLEGRVVRFGNRRFTGIGGSPASWSSEYAGENSLSKENIAGTILVTHQPPAGVKYFQRDNVLHVCHSERSEESQSGKILRSAQDDNIRLTDAPLAHICGHVHHTHGIGYIGETLVIKLASSSNGNIAIMNLENLEVEFLRLL